MILSASATLESLYATSTPTRPSPTLQQVKLILGRQQKAYELEQPDSPLAADVAILLERLQELPEPMSPDQVLNAVSDLQGNVMLDPTRLPEDSRWYRSSTPDSTEPSDVSSVEESASEAPT